VAQEFRNRYPDSEILFVGAEGKMEMTKVPEAGFKIKGLWISGLQRKLTTRNLLFPVKLIHSFLAARKIVRTFKPHAVVGFGGYASGPMMLAATAKRIPSMIQEQNSHAGITNKRLGEKVSRICVAYEGMEKYFPKAKITITGNPVRQDILNLTDKKTEGLTHFNLSDDKPVVLILGGSLGARSINNCVADGLDEFINHNVQLLWQTGKLYHAEMNQRASGKDLENIRILEFIKSMDLAYAVADVVISRAGALSISELCIAGKPVIFVPSANVAEDHQTKNAKALVNKNAALMVTDAQAPDALISTALNLVDDQENRKVLSTNIKNMARPEATKEIVNELEKLIL
jgi:UDP-N-acetylglucosamine--N-acetylmuramyl-(pentapeptide) pyrophosphoryl-undecaprenol N-acetylglucosamine transferase